MTKAGVPHAVTVSVVVCTRDRPVLLERCLRSLVSCRPLPDEVVVVDQSGDDRSAQAVSRIGSPLIRHVRDTRRGLSVAQNHGISEAIGEVVLITDDDCVLPLEWVGRALHCFTAEPFLALLAGRVLPLADDRPGRLPVSTRTSVTPLQLGPSSLPWDVGSGNNFALRRAVALEVGGNDERLGPGAPLRGGADMDLFRRVLRTGAPGRYDPELVVLHEQATIAERLARRIPYGFGMGACLALWHRQGDAGVPAVARAWIRLRLGRLVAGARSGDLLRMREELMVLWGTVRGVAAVRRAPAGPVTSMSRQP